MEDFDQDVDDALESLYALAATLQLAGKWDAAKAVAATAEGLREQMNRVREELRIAKKAS